MQASNSEVSAKCGDSPASRAEASSALKARPEPERIQVLQSIDREFAHCKSCQFAGERA